MNFDFKKEKNYVQNLIFFQSFSRNFRENDFTKNCCLQFLAHYLQKGLFVSQLYPFGNQYGDIALPNDMEDFSSPEIKLQTPINFFQRQYQSIFVNENGLLSFLTEIPSFFNFEFPSLDYPIIAILYSDVDCRGWCLWIFFG